MPDNGKNLKSQEYRDNLARQLKSLRSQGEEGRKIAEVLLSKQEETKEYKESKMNYEEKLILLESLLNSINPEIYQESQKESITINNPADSFDTASSIVKEIINKSNGDTFNEKESELIQNFTNICYNKYRGLAYDSDGSREFIGSNYGIDIFTNNFNQLSQISKENISLQTIKKSLIERKNSKSYNGDSGKFRIEQKNVYQHASGLRKSDYLFSSQNTLKKYITETLKSSTNKEFIYEAILLISKNWLRDFTLPENIIKIFNQKDSIKELLNKDRMDQKGDKVLFSEIIKLLGNNDIAVPLEDLLKYKNKFDFQKNNGSYLDYGDRKGLRNKYFYKLSYFDQKQKKLFKKLVSEEELTTRANNAIKDGVINKQDIIELQEVVSNEEILKNIPKEYLTVDFINKNLEDISLLLEDNGAPYVIRNAPESNQKFDESILGLFKYKSDGKEGEFVDILLNRFELTKRPKCVDQGILFSKMYEKGMINDTTLSWFDAYHFTQAVSKDPTLNMGSPGAIKLKNERKRSERGSVTRKNFKTYMQLLLNSDDINGIKSLGYNIGSIEEKYLTYNDINLIIQKIASAVKNEEDLESLESLFSYKLNTNPSIIYLAYILYGTYPGYYDKHESGYGIHHKSLGKHELKKLKALPSSVFRLLIEKDILDLSDLPKIVPNPQIPNLEKIFELNASKIEKEEDIKKEQERIAKIKQDIIEKESTAKFEAIQKVMNGNIEKEPIINYEKEDQKYILCVDIESSTLEFISDNIDYHSGIKNKYSKDSHCIGGGRISINEDEKSILLHDQSGSYGGVGRQYNEAMNKLIQTKYQGYSVVIR